MAINLGRDAETQAVSSIRRYVAEELEQDIGDPKAGLLLDFFLREIGPSVYNRAIVDAQAFLQERVTDLDSSVYEPEFAYRTGPGA